MAINTDFPTRDKMRQLVAQLRGQWVEGAKLRTAIATNLALMVPISQDMSDYFGFRSFFERFKKLHGNRLIETAVRCKLAREAQACRTFIRDVAFVIAPSPIRIPANK